MSHISRRDFIKMGATFAAALGLSAGFVPRVAEALEELASGGAPVLWLQGQSCSGCSVSFLNSEHPSPAEVLTGYISLLFHQTISAATGHVAVDVVNQAIEKGGYYLVVEGAMPLGMPEACLMGHERVIDQVARAAVRAQAVVAVGSCAASGGIPAAENNPTGAVSVPDFLKQKGIDKPVISLPGCPAHPDWLVGTLVHVLKFGLPEMDALGRPKAFYGRLIHEQCPRFADYERENFARSFSDDGCLFKLGCLGPITHADCTTRYWNRGANTCIKAGAPCIGCAAPDFARSAALPFYRKGETSGGKEA
jgi:hydrogenase small subunit